MLNNLNVGLASSVQQLMFAHKLVGEGVGFEICPPMLPDGSHNKDPASYLAADPLAKFGFHGWVGPEPHHPAPEFSGLSMDRRHLSHCYQRLWVA